MIDYMEIKVVIKGQEPEKEYIYLSESAISLVDAMDKMGLVFYRPCGGLKRCLRCSVRFLYGAPEMTADDERALDFSDMRDGWRLGCGCVITKDCKIEVPAFLTSDIKSVAADSQLEEASNRANEDDIAIAVDIGTTTIAFAAVSSDTGDIIKTSTIANRQIKYGADVMARIQASMEGHRDELSELVLSDIIKFDQNIIDDTRINHKLIISGNTTMIHLLMKLNVSGMASYPFTPEQLKAISFKENNRQSFIMPSISAYIGGDIVSGLYFINKAKKPSKFILVDLGTNAEIVLFNGKKYFCASASAGPALEGGNISCGVASVEGAISLIAIDDGRVDLETIGGKEPIGICGSGIIDLIYELYRNSYIDEGGLLADEFADEGFVVCEGITLTGEDIQQVLLAKSAIYSAIQILMKEAKMSFSEVEKLYLAGGLGASIKPASVTGIGILPKKLEGKIESIGNASLEGDIAYLKDPDENGLNEIIENATVIELSNHPDFENLFLNNLMLQ